MGKEITKIFTNYKQRYCKTLIKSQHLGFVGCKSAGYSKVSSELALKTNDLASMQPFVWECLGLQVSEQNPHTFTAACFSTCQD